MALRSVLDIDVNDRQLDALVNKLQQYKRTAENLPTISPGGGLAPGGGRRAAGDTGGERAVSNAERLARAWGTMREHSREVVRNVREMAQRMLSLTGWLGALSGAATGFGFLGFNALASSAANQRQDAARAFTTIGGLRSSQIALGRFGNVNNMLSSLGAATQTPGSPGWKALQMLQQAAQGTGKEFQFEAGEDSAGLLDKVLPAVQAVMRNTRPDQRGFMFDKLEMQNLGIGSFAEAQTLISRTPEELNSQIARRQGMQRELDIPEDSARKFQDFVSTIDRAGSVIKNSLINQVVALAGPLGELSQTVTTLLQSFIKWALSSENVEAMAAAIKRLADFLKNEDFAADWQAFKSELIEAVEALKGFVEFVNSIGKFFGGKTDAGPPVPLAQQPEGTKPAIGGLYFDWGTKSWRRAEGTDDQQLQQQDEAREKWRQENNFSHPFLSPISFRGGADGGRGLPIMANAPLPVEIVGFRGFGDKKEQQAPAPAAAQDPWQGMLHQATYRTGFEANDNPNSLLGMIEKYESGGRNVFNYKHADDPTGFTASGYYQMIDSTWREAKKMAGLPSDMWPRAIDAPREAQKMAAEALLRERGLQPWSTNEPLMKALREYGAGFGAPGQSDGSAAPSSQPAPRRDFHPAKPPSVDVRIQNETGGNMVTMARGLAV